MAGVAHVSKRARWWQGPAILLALGMSADGVEAATERSLPARPRAGFEANLGQWPAAVRMVARDGAAVLVLSDRDATWRLPSGTVRMRWSGGRPRTPRGEGERPGRVHYARGPRSTWRSDVPLYDRAVYRDVYPGIDLVFHDQRGPLEYDFVVAPGADPRAIRLAFTGEATLRPDGSLAVGRLVQRAPEIHQGGDGERRPVRGRYALRRGRETTVGFALADYDRAQPLIIDPQVTYVTTIDDRTDNVADVAVDASGAVWLVGNTDNQAFPITGDAADSTFSPLMVEGYVVKLDPDGKLVYATYLGGSGVNCIGGVAVDEEGNAYLAGTTDSTDFPIVVGGIADTAPGGVGDGFLAKLDGSGHLVRSTYFGGSGSEACPGRGYPVASIVVAPENALYAVIGSSTVSTRFPADGAVRDHLDADGLLARFDRDFRPQWGRFVGGSYTDGMTRVAVDAAGNAYVTGTVSRTLGTGHDFATTPGAFQRTTESDQAPVLRKYAPNGDLVYSTFLTATRGPSGGRWNPNLAVAADGTAFVATVEGSPDMPATAGAFQANPRGGSDVFVFAVRPDGGGLRYGTYLGGSSSEQGNLTMLGIALDDAGQLALGIATFSSDFPLRDPIDDRRSQQVIAKLSADGSGLVYSTYLTQAPNSLAHRDGALYVAGHRGDTQFGVGVVKIDEAPAPCVGDCDGDATVRVNELVTGVRIALGELAADACAIFDGDGDGTVSIAELIGAVGALLNGCGRVAVAAPTFDAPRGRSTLGGQEVRR